METLPFLFIIRFRKNLLPYRTEYVILTYELVITNQKEK